MIGLGHAWIIAVLVLVIVLIVFGPGRLSQLGGALGRSVKDFHKEQADSRPSDSSLDR